LGPIARATKPLLEGLEEREGVPPIVSYGLQRPPIRRHDVLEADAPPPGETPQSPLLPRTHGPRFDDARVAVEAVEIPLDVFDGVGLVPEEFDESAHGGLLLIVGASVAAKAPFVTSHTRTTPAEAEVKTRSADNATAITGSSLTVHVRGGGLPSRRP
jgi:hypothetical protein